jgi:chaperonin GroEL|tara:strand:+ start:11056 stop:12654 length:1599 start_codon:yes stop_codon:yes gene_type:complete
MEIKREIYSGQELDAKLQKGINKLADAVKVTMGPKGKLVLIHRPGNHPIVTKDGVTVAQAVNLVNEVENLGAQIIKESASRTAEEAGDGTTTATVLAQFIYNEGLKYKIAGFDVMQIKEGVEAARDLLITAIKNVAREVNDSDDLLKVATISANGEKDVAQLIVNAIEAAGPDGHVIVEEAKGFSSSLQVVDGFQMERGFLSPYFVTDKNKMTAEFSKPLILMADRSFNSVRELMKPLEIALDMGRPIIVIANDIEGDALQGLVLNRVKGALRVAAIKSPGFGGARHDLLLDLESIVGGKVLDSAFDMTAFEPEMFGSCKKMIIQKSKTLVIKEEERSEETQGRMDIIKNRLSYPGLSDNEKTLLKYRIQQLSGGIAILRVGAATESELIERYDRVDDALHATRAALEEGVLPGGGIALYRLSKELSNHNILNDDKSFIAGFRLLSEACLSPFKQILDNAGLSHYKVLNELKETESNFGYDVRNKKFGDMFELGVLDPAKVSRCAIENAVSAATMLLMADCSLIEVNTEQKD